VFKPVVGNRASSSLLIKNSDIDKELNYKIVALLKTDVLIQKDMKQNYEMKKNFRGRSQFLIYPLGT
jgi:BioD-like phosphotransacetylase family protein